MTEQKKEEIKKQKTANKITDNLKINILIVFVAALLSWLILPLLLSAFSSGAGGMAGGMLDAAAAALVILPVWGGLVLYLVPRMIIFVYKKILKTPYSTFLIIKLSLISYLIVAIIFLLQ